MIRIVETTWLDYSNEFYVGMVRVYGKVVPPDDHANIYDAFTEKFQELHDWVIKNYPDNQIEMDRMYQHIVNFWFDDADAAMHFRLTWG